MALAELGQLESDLFKLLEDKKIHWKQRSKLFRLKKGDNNTKAFHGAANARKRVNSIMKLKNSANS